VVELKRDPHAPFEAVQYVFIIQGISKTRYLFRPFIIVFKLI
jgi:hypothetical protein